MRSDRNILYVCATCISVISFGCRRIRRMFAAPVQRSPASATATAAAMVLIRRCPKDEGDYRPGGWIVWFTRAGYRQRRITVKKRIDKGRARGKRKRSIYGGICHLYMLLYYVIRRYIGQIALWMHFQDKVHPDERTPLPPSPPFQRYYHDYWLYTSVTGGRDGGGGGNTDVYYTWHWYYFGLKPQRPTFITI